MKKNGFRKEVDKEVGKLEQFIKDESSSFSVDVESILSKIIQKKNRRSKG